MYDYLLVSMTFNPLIGGYSSSAIAQKCHNLKYCITKTSIKGVIGNFTKITGQVYLYIDVMHYV